MRQPHFGEPSRLARNRSLRCTRLAQIKGGRTEKPGGTEASFPVLLANVEMGMIKSARGAGGCFSDDAKNVASSVAAEHQCS